MMAGKDLCTPFRRCPAERERMSMRLKAKQIHALLAQIKPFAENISLETRRRVQNSLGKLMRVIHPAHVRVNRHDFGVFPAAWVLPKDIQREGVILYLHGGGYTCGGLEYALGFGATLADECGVRVFCAAYRLAPESRFPAAVEDAVAAYRYLLDQGYPPEEISLCGESAGGGLCYSLCMYLRQRELPLPGSVVAISPWVDLTGSGESNKENRDKDATLSSERLDFCARCYTDSPAEPLASPLFGNLAGMPPSLIFAGGDEMLLSDAKRLHDKLRHQGCVSQLSIRPERWHAYVLYGLADDREDMARINAFLGKNRSQERKLV